MNFKLFKPYSLLFYSTLLLGVFIVMTANNWVTVWLGLELNLYSFIPLLLQSNNNLEKEAAVKYFLVQALASAIMLTAALNMQNMTLSSAMITLSLLIKLGMAPCHFWLPSVMNSLSWPMCWLLSTVQKIAPLFILMQILTFYSPMMISSIAMLSALLGGMGGLSQTQLRPILAYSSIGHLGWMTAGSLVSMYMSTFYFISYMVILSSLMFLLYTAQLKSINTLFSTPQTPTNMSLVMSLMSLAGLPPLFGFYPKLFIIVCLINMKLLFLVLVLILSSVLNLYFYMKIISNTFLKSPPTQFLFLNKTKTPYISSIIILSSTLTMTIMLMWL